MPTPTNIPLVTPWHGQAPPDEQVLRRQLTAEGLNAYTWANGPNYQYPEHQHDYHKVLYCLQGSISFFWQEQGKEVELKPGDRLDLPAHISHQAHVGPQGVKCLEAARY